MVISFAWDGHLRKTCCKQNYNSNRLQRASKDEPTGPGTGRETQEAVYNYDPATDVPDEFQPYYKGIQACMWTEYISKSEHLEYNR